MNKNFSNPRTNRNNDAKVLNKKFWFLYQKDSVKIDFFVGLRDF